VSRIQGVSAPTISRVLNAPRPWCRDFRVKTVGHDGVVRVLALSRDSQIGETHLRERGYRVERRDLNVFFVTGKENA
jgi:hypothetical protein